MIKAAPATPMASVNVASARGHASRETAASWIVETREDIANRILRIELTRFGKPKNF
jgi:hypothetical protein